MTCVTVVPCKTWRGEEAVCEGGGKSFFLRIIKVGARSAVLL